MTPATPAAATASVAPVKRRHWFWRAGIGIWRTIDEIELFDKLMIGFLSAVFSFVEIILLAKTGMSAWLWWVIGAVIFVVFIVGGFFFVTAKAITNLVKRIAANTPQD